MATCSLKKWRQILEKLENAPDQETIIIFYSTINFN